MFNFDVLAIVVFTPEIKTLQFWDTPFMYNVDVYVLCDMLKFNIISLIFVKAGNHFSFLLGGCCCRNFEMLTMWTKNLVWHRVEDYYCARFHIILIRGLCAPTCSMVTMVKSLVDKLLACRSHVSYEICLCNLKT